MFRPAQTPSVPSETPAMLGCERRDRTHPDGRGRGGYAQCLPYDEETHATRNWIPDRRTTRGVGPHARVGGRRWGGWV
jgi:hypothetical protein